MGQLILYTAKLGPLGFFKVSYYRNKLDKYLLSIHYHMHRKIDFRVMYLRLYVLHRKQF